MDTYYYSDGTTKDYWDNTKILHREDGPAEIWQREDGTIIHEGWWIDGKYHREDGPAFITHYENGKIEVMRWLINNKMHRLDGPAYIWYYPCGKIKYKSWWIGGICYKKEQFDAYRLNQLINEELS